MRARLAESLDRALKLGDGTVILSEEADGRWTDRVLSVKFACPDCGVGLEEVEPRTFSFNSPHGACRDVRGLGTVTLEETGAGAWKRGLSPAGTRSVPVPFSRLRGQGNRSVWWEQGTGNARVAATASPLSYQTEVLCPACGGARLRPEALAVTLGDRSIFEVSTIPAAEAGKFFEALRFDPSLERVGPPLVVEMVKRLGFLGRVGLDYLTLDRGAGTLSGGELQRVRLAAQIGSGLVGVCYVLDEPTSGLHPRDTERLLECLKSLRDAGNTMLVVEHDESVIRAADWVVDLGPGAGPDGGRLLVEGPPATLEEATGSVTARFLHAVPKAPNAATDRLSRSPSAIEVVGASDHNLRGVDARFPIGCITCVTGVRAGLAKSTLAQDVLARAARRHLGFGGPRPGAYVSLRGLDVIETFVDIDQAPIGRSPRSTPATFVGVFDEIRVLFARTREAKIRGYKSARFSFNAKGGRCETCLGMGARKIEMQFLADLFVPLRGHCRGLRAYNRPTLEVRYRGLSIGEVLQLRVDAALALFDVIPKIRRGLAALHQAGLGYVTLGQSSTTLSGGESQRVKLAAGLNRVESAGALYVLDEPTTGLHAADVANLLVVLAGLADRGSTLVVIEHNLEVVRAADWVIDPRTRRRAPMAAGWWRRALRPTSRRCPELSNRPLLVDEAAWPADVASCIHRQWQLVWLVNESFEQRGRRHYAWPLRGRRERSVGPLRRSSVRRSLPPWAGMSGRPSLTYASEVGRPISRQPGSRRR